MAYGRSEASPSYHEDAPPHGLYNCCCCLSLSLLLFLLILIGIALFFLLIMKPSKPGFDLDSVTLQSFHVDNSNSNTNAPPRVFLSMSVTLVFSASNPNKVSIVYSPTKLNCLYKGALLGVANVPSFTQPAHSHTVLTAAVGVNHLNVLQSSSLDLINDATIHDKVTLYINGPVEASVKVFGLKSPKVKALVNCGIVIHPQEGEITEKQCNVGQLTFSD